MTTRTRVWLENRIPDDQVAQITHCADCERQRGAWCVTPLGGRRRPHASRYRAAEIQTTSLRQWLATWGPILWSKPEETR